MPEIRFEEVWRRDDQRAEADAIALWQRTGAVAPDEERAARAKSLCVLAYAGAELVGISSVELAVMEAVRSRVAFLRAFVLPEHRRGHTATELTVRTVRLLEAWSRDHPHEDVKGMAAIIQSRELTEKGRQPVWPMSGLTVIGYSPAGHQIRLVWFAHARL